MVGGKNRAVVVCRWRGTRCEAPALASGQRGYRASCVGVALGKPTKQLVSGEVRVDQWDSIPQELGKGAKQGGIGNKSGSSFRQEMMA